MMTAWLRRAPRGEELPVGVGQSRGVRRAGAGGSPQRREDEQDAGSPDCRQDADHSLNELTAWGPKVFHRVRGWLGWARPWNIAGRSGV